MIQIDLEQISYSAYVLSRSENASLMAHRNHLRRNQMQIGGSQINIR